MHFLEIFNSRAVVFAAFILAITASYITIRSIIKFEFEGNASRQLYTFTAIFGSIALLGSLVILGLIISYIA